jgi:parallel beta-helix repeat protein
MAKFAGHWRMGFLRAFALALALPMLTTALAVTREVHVNSTDSLRSAIASAQPGTEIVLDNGSYRLAGTVLCSNPGEVSAPIVVRAAVPLGAKIVSTAVEAFKITAPNWTFMDLDLQGACADHGECEHAFHVEGRATGFRLLGNRIHDFNAHLKVNADPEHNTPDDGLVSENKIFNQGPRFTGNPVTFINIDNGSRWVVRQNVIYDFHKAGGDGISYGAFAKGGTALPLFERNLVFCSLKDRIGGSRVGLSFGGGGMSPAQCGPAWDASVPCDPEVSGGIMRNNIIVNCSEEGIYLNRATSTKILYNTLLATGGIDFRFPGSTGEVHGNVLSSRIRVRNGGAFEGSDNLSDVPVEQFGSWYRDPMHGDFRRKGDLHVLIGRGRASSEVVDDFYGRWRGAGQADWGAIQSSLGDCGTATASGRWVLTTEVGRKWLQIDQSVGLPKGACAKGVSYPTGSKEPN